MAFNILVLHSDRSTGMNFVHSLQDAKKTGWGQDVNIIGTCSHPVRMQLCQNDITYVVDEKSAEDLKGLTRKVEGKIQAPVDLVYETKSADHMLKVSRLRDSLPVFLPPHHLVEVFEDKFATYQHLRKRGLPVPETYIIENQNDLEHAFKMLAHNTVWIRAVKGQAGNGAFSTSSIEEAKKVIEAQQGWGRYTVAEKLPIEQEHNWKDRLSSNILPGEMVTWVALYNQGQLVGGQVRKRLYWEHADLTVSGVTGYSGANMTISRNDVHDLSDKIIRSFDWAPHGAVGVDYVADKRGEIKLTEIQASRFYTSTYPLSLLGLNLPRMYVDVFRGADTPKDLINPCPEGQIYIQRFGSDSMMVHRDKILSDLDEGFVRPKAPPQQFSHQSVRPI